MRVLHMIWVASLLGLGCGDVETSAPGPYDRVLHALGLGQLAANPNGLGAVPAGPNGLGAPPGASGGPGAGSSGPIGCAEVCARLAECGQGDGSCASDCQRGIAGQPSDDVQRVFRCVVSERCSRIERCIDDLVSGESTPPRATQPSPDPGDEIIVGGADDPDR